MRVRWNLLPKSLALRLYGGALLAFMAVTFMALAATTYADYTASAARHFFDIGLSGAADAAELELLVEKHRRVIETAPVDLDRMEAAKNERDSTEILEQIRSLLGKARHPGIAALSHQLPPLEAKSREVLHLSSNFAQDAALKVVDDYTKLVRAFVEAVRQYKRETLESAAHDVASITAISHKLTKWIMAGAAVALLLIGPLSLLIVRSVVHRLHGITVAMRRLARNDTSVTVRYTGDKDEVGEMARALSVFQRNAIELLDKQSEMRQLNAWLDIALNNMTRGLSMFDGQHRLMLCNQRFGEIYGLDLKVTQPGTHFNDILAACAANGAVRDPGASAERSVSWLISLSESLAHGQPANQLRQLPDGRSVMVNFQPLPGGGWVDVHEDVTEKRAAEEQINRLAQIDTLTEVGNRRYFRERLEILLARLGPNSGFAVHWIDLDRFKEVNDTLGHPTGDALLKEVAVRLRAIVRSGDLVARLGGDEFAIVQAGVTEEGQAEVVSRRILKAMCKPFDIMGQRVVIGSSVGVALAPAHGRTSDELLKNADIALYKAKSGGRGQVVFYRPEHEIAMKQRREMENDLRHALEDNQLELHYQPIISLETGSVISCEALMRWRHPQRGMIPPGVFIPVAEESGLIVELGAWAINQACQDAAKWPSEARVAVNLSAVQFGSNDLAQVTEVALTAAGLSADRLELEVTESLLLNDDSRTIELLHRLRDMGVSIALDDFGTGFASLSYLRRFPFDKLKIDQTFVRDLPDRDDCSAIVSAVSGLARMLGIQTVAEGVETEQHLQLVRAAGCDAVQGYLFSRPVPAAELPKVLDACESRLRAAA